MRLIKKKLEAIPLPERQYWMDKHYEVKAEHYLYEGEQIIVATIWYSLNAEPTFRVFIAKDSYVTKLYSDRRGWSDAMISNFVDGRHFWYWRAEDEEKYKVYADVDSLTVLKGACRVDKSEREALWLINHIQSMIRDKRQREKDDRQEAIWDAELDTTPPEPADMEQWIKDKVFLKERYIFYETTKSDKKKARCSYCLKTMTIKNPRHKGRGVCPRCGSSVEYRNGNKQKYLDSSWRDVQLLQTTTAGKVVIRHYTYKQNITVRAWNDFKIENYKNETTRKYVNRARDISVYYYELFKRRKMRFVGGSSSGDSLYGRDIAHIYMDNYEAICNLLKGGMEYMPKELFDNVICVERLIRSTGLTGMVERLWKQGLHNLAVDLCRSYTQYISEKALFKNNSVENDDIRIFRLVDITGTELKHWKELKKIGKRPMAAEIELMRSLGVSFSRMAEIAKYMSIKKALAYLVKLKEDTGKCDTTMYKDYLNLLKELKMDMKSDFNLYPRDLRRRHDELVEIKNEVDNAKLKRKLDREYSVIAKMEKELNERYAVENKECFIRAPHSAYEIAIEGQKLHHCVGGDGYRDKMKRGESFILFVRKKDAPDNPWWTIEVSSGHNIIQYHGWGNRDKDKDKEDVEPIMKVFRRHLEKLKLQDNSKKEKQY